MGAFGSGPAAVSSTGTLKPMRALYLGLAAAFTVAALALNFIDLSRAFAILAIIIAGIFLVLGLRVTAEQREPVRVELDAKQEQTIRTMLAEGRDSSAYSQIQLWFRGSTASQAQQVVTELKRTQN